MTPKRDAAAKVERPEVHPTTGGISYYLGTMCPFTIPPYYHATEADAYMDQRDERVRELEGLLRETVPFLEYRLTYAGGLIARILAALGEKNV